MGVPSPSAVVSISTKYATSNQIQLQNQGFLGLLLLGEGRMPNHRHTSPNHLQSDMQQMIFFHTYMKRIRLPNLGKGIRWGPRAEFTLFEFQPQK